MANFTLNITTENSSELLDIVSRIAGSLPLPVPHAEAKVLMEQRKSDIREAMGADAELLAGVEVSHERPVGEILPAVPGEPAVLGETPDRDAHGIKRDDRIHSGAAEPFKADGTWKRRKNIDDVVYESAYLELAREARAAGVYTGPAIPELELEDRVVDVTVENHTGAALVTTATTDTEVHVKVAATAPVPAAPAPTPAAAPAPTGMSAETTPTYQQAVMKLVQAAGPKAPMAMLRIMKLTSAPDATPEQLRATVRAAEMVTLAPVDRPTKGAQAIAEAFIALGYEVDLAALADLGVVA